MKTDVEQKKNDEKSEKVKKKSKKRGRWTKD